MITPQKLMCKCFAHLPKISAWDVQDATIFPTNEFDWWTKVNKVRKTVKPGGESRVILS